MDVMATKEDFRREITARRINVSYLVLLHTCQGSHSGGVSTYFVVQLYLPHHCEGLG